MKELRLIIENPELEKELENFEPVVYFRRPKIGDFSILSDTDTIKPVTQAYSWLSSIILTPKLKPLPEPDWNKLAFLQPGWWVAMDGDGAFFAYEQEPLLSGDSFTSPGYLHYKLHRDLFKSALPTIPTDRWREAKWQVPK